MRSLAIAIAFSAGTLVFASASLVGTTAAREQSAEEIPAVYGEWLNQDVVYIISNEERTAFLQLRLEDERKEFIEQFWRRRNPVPGSVENFFEEEHYRRIAYANAHFGTTAQLGWRTNRGHVYIVFGTPDSIDAHPAHAPDLRTPEEGRGFVTAYPFEIWKYRYLEGVGPDVALEFVDRTGANDFHLVANKEERKRLFKTGFPNSDVQGTDLPPVETLEKAPQVKFRELSELLTARIVRNQVSFDHSVSFEPVTDCTVLTSITVTVRVPPSSGDSAGTSSRRFEGLIRVQDSEGWVLGGGGRCVSASKNKRCRGVAPFVYQDFSAVLRELPGANCVEECGDGRIRDSNPATRSSTSAANTSLNGWVRGDSQI